MSPTHAVLLTISDFMSLKPIFCRNPVLKNARFLCPCFCVVTMLALIGHIVVAQVDNKKQTLKKHSLKPVFFCRNLGLGGFGFNENFLGTFVFLGGGGYFFCSCCSCCLCSCYFVVFVMFWCLFLLCCCLFVAVYLLLSFLLMLLSLFLFVVVDLLLWICCLC